MNENMKFTKETKQINSRLKKKTICKIYMNKTSNANQGLRSSR